MPKSATPAPTLVHIKLTVNGIRPAIWRRIRTPDTITLGDLHAIIQIALGWDSGHLHAFEIGGKQYSDLEMMEDAEDEDGVTIRGLIRKGVSRFGYTYDFGDNWEVAVLIEKKAPPPGSLAEPICVAGARAGPPEDSGGIGGYYDLVIAWEARNKRKEAEEDEEHGKPDVEEEEEREKEGEEPEHESDEGEDEDEYDDDEIDDDFDPEAFSLDEVNARLKSAFGAPA